MNLLILVFDVAFALVAAILSILGLNTLKAIRHLGIGKSFWIPISMSGVIFSIGSVFAVFHEMNLSLTANTEEVMHASLLLALCILVGSTYSYSRKVKKNLTKSVSVPERKAQEALKPEAQVQESLEIEASIQERKVLDSSEAETPPGCKHQFGYLRTLQKDASIPEECLGCHKLLKCKHSLVIYREHR